MYYNIIFNKKKHNANKLTRKTEIIFYCLEYFGEQIVFQFSVGYSKNEGKHSKTKFSYIFLHSTVKVYTYNVFIFEQKQTLRAKNSGKLTSFSELLTSTEIRM